MNNCDSPATVMNNSDEAKQARRDGHVRYRAGLVLTLSQEQLDAEKAKRAAVGSDPELIKRRAKTRRANTKKRKLAEKVDAVAVMVTVSDRQRAIDAANESGCEWCGTGSDDDCVGRCGS